MESTIGLRIRQLREAKQLSVVDFAKAAGVKPSAVYGLESGANKPSLETVGALRLSFPGLNTEWLQFGEGEMFSRALTPAPRAAEPAPDFTSAAGTQDAVVSLLLREQLTEAQEQNRVNRALITWLQAELGKLPGSSDAAGHYAPIPPRQPAGFNQAARAIAFNAYIEAQLEGAGALVSR